MSWDDDEPPEDLSAWLRAGFRRTEARQWRRWRFELPEAQAWHAADVRQALTAAQWRTAAVTPQTVADWRAAGIGPSDAVRWHEFGIDLKTAVQLKAEGKEPGSDLMEDIEGRTGGVSRPLSAAERRLQEGMERFQRSGVPYEVIGGYYEAEWFDEDAVAWAQRGIAAGHAQLWRSLGLRPAEAAALGADPATVVAEWWRAGIPYDEVANWIGAGLTAAEAVAQRAAGVTVEQAATMRALRNPGS